MLHAVDQALTADTARALTEQVKQDAQALWRQLLRLYEGGAHTALGYTSWAEYCRTEFDMGRSRAYQMLEAAHVDDALRQSTIVDSLPSSEGQARELAPLREEPQLMAAAWEAATDHAQQEQRSVTANDVREAVDIVQHAEVLDASEPAEQARHKLAVHFSSQADDWATPPDFFQAVAQEFQLDLDVCALPTSAKCPRYFTPEDDGLAQDWTGTCWMNPPYGDEIPRWVAKAHQSAQAGATIVALVPARVDTGWWWDYCRHHEVRFIRGRLKFGNSPHSAPFPSALIIFGHDAQVQWWEWQP